MATDHSPAAEAESSDLSALERAYAQDLLVVATEYRRFSSRVMLIVGGFVAVLLLMRLVSGEGIGQVLALGLIGFPLLIGAALALGYHFGIRRRLQILAKRQSSRTEA